MIKPINKKIKLEHQLQLVKSGDETMREKVINDFFPFVIQTLSDLLNRYIEVENDPYLSIGLEAFNKALETYDESKGKFVSYARTLIKNKVYDEMRKEQKESYELVDEETINQVPDKNEIEAHENAQEIETFKTLLRTFDISFEELVEESPTHSKTRLDTIEAGFILSKQDMMMRQLYDTGKVPRNKLAELTGLSIKQIRRHRQFIIAVAIALKEELPFICGYIYEVGGVRLK